MSIQTPIRAALFGAGLIGRRHFTSSFQQDCLSIDWIVDTDPRARDFAEQYPVPVFSTLDELLSKHQPDAAILATPTSLHAVQAMALIDEGIPVLIEKPITVSTKSAEDLVRRAEEKSVPILVGHHRRHNPLIQQAKAIIESGSLGQLKMLQATCWFHKPESYFDIAPWRKEPGAGPISVNLIHDVDLIRYLCGDIVDVQARGIASSRGYANEEAALAMLTFASGALGCISVSDIIAAPWSWELTAAENPAYPRTQESCYLIGGTKGSLSVPDLKLWQHVTEPDWFTGIRSTQEPYQQCDPLVAQLEHFADVVRGTAEPLVSGREGLESLRVVEAIQSAVGQEPSLRKTA